MYNTQVTSTHYNFIQYVTEERWCSYYNQMKEIISSGAESVLLIGVGDGLIPYIMSKVNPAIKIVTYDFDKRLNPDICGDVRKLSLQVDKFDAIVCCQVLEHLPFDEFEGVLSQIGMSMNKGGKLILSLPDSGSTIRFWFRCPYIKEHNFLYKVPQMRKTEYQFDGEHYWEINGARIYTAGKIRKIIKKKFKIEREYLVNHNPYHRFYIAAPMPE